MIRKFANAKRRRGYVLKIGVVGYGLEGGLNRTRTNSMGVQQTHQGRWTKTAGFPKFGTTNSHNMYVAAAV